MLSYVWKHLSRNIKTTVITLFSFLCVLAVISSVQQSAQSRQQSLISMAEAIEVRGNVADVSGYVSNGLNMDSYYALQFLDEEKLLKPYVKDVWAKGIFDGVVLLPLQDGDFMEIGDCTLLTLTSANADDSIRFGKGIEYEENVDDSIWLTDENVCVVSPDLMQNAVPGEDGSLYLHLNAEFVRQSDMTVKTLTFSFRIIGTTQDVNSSVIVPFFTVLRACEKGKAPYTLDSLSFTIVDNSQLEILRHMAGTFFLDAKATETKGGFSMVLKDARYLKLTREAEKNLAVMQLLQPILYLCALGAGVMLVVMQMRGRKKEMAVIRSLGAGRLHVMVQSILEYALICLPVTLFALLVWRELSPMTVFGVWLAFMAGALCTIVRFSMIPLVKQIRELEE